ncbi:MAG TPA: O-antigen ligase family protein [Gaiellaceae bacterium]|nr:O-antigen ligase family protein [Gaiellaceae bacterium]
MLVRNAVLGLAVAVCVFALSYANGGFDTSTRAYAGISAWWLLGTGAAIGIAAARERVDRLALAALGLLALYAVWALLSMSWAPDGGRAFDQFDQISLYVAVLALAIVIARLVPASTILAGVALAISAIGVVALVSRFFPSSFGVEPSTALPSLNNRLNFPLGYWNGLGIELALAYPLLFSIMTSRRSRVASALAALPLPVIAAVMYLTSSRGAFVAAGVAVLAYILLTPNRWSALVATALAGAAGAVGVALLVHKNALVSGVMSFPIAVHQGHRAALEIGIACIVTALVWAGLAEVGRRLPPPHRYAGRAVAGVLVLAAVVGIALSHPIAKFDAFKGNKANFGGGSTTLVQQHLLSSSGSGRWQFWAAASDEFQAHPLNGGGAGSWEFWWLQHGSLPAVSQFAHSLYLETLAELGIVGLLLLGGALLVGLAGAVRSALELRSAEVAAATAATIAFFAAAAYDWVWQLAGIAIVGVGLLGVALGARSSTRAVEWGRFGVARPLLAILAVAAIVPQVVVLASSIHIQNSQDAAHAGDGAKAKSEALAAKAVEPWNADAYLQLALVEEGVGEYGAARAALASGIRRSELDWRLWYNAARIDVKRGDIASARRDLAQVRRLYPKSPYLQTGS